MSMHFICLTATGGVPILTRKKGDCDTVSKHRRHKTIKPPNNSRWLDCVANLTVTFSDVCAQLPFSTVGSLNGVHMFCKSQGAQLTATYLDDDTVIVWKDYENALTLIGIGREYPEKVIRDFLDLMFNATIFSIGLNEVKLNKNPDQLKRELKVGRSTLRTKTLSFPWFSEKKIREFCGISSKNAIQWWTSWSKTSTRTFSN